ncbi:MAG: DinB family protein [Arcobacter sp.]|nr:DinB family protein [Arcobacter sp.]
MKNKINTKFEKLENDRKNLFLRLKKVNKDILNFKPQENKWSIIQIIHHLYKSEQLSIVYIKRKLRDTTKVKKSGLGSLGRGLILEWTLRFPTKLTAPSNVSDVPDIAKLELYNEKWVRIRKDLSEIIENTTVEILKSDIFKHPSVGEMNMVHALKFMQAHFDNHKKQIDNILQIKNNLV